VKAQRKPETVAQLTELQARMRRYFDLGIGGPDCLTGACHIQAAFATGEGYGPPRDACTVCTSAMVAWGTRPVRDTGHYRLPPRRLPAPLPLAQPLPGVSTPAGAVPDASAA